MARKPRTDFEDAWHHIGNRGVDRRRVFDDDYDKRTFMNILSETFDDVGTELHAYCLMSNHYHLLTHTPVASLSESMQHLSSRYTMAYNKRHKRDGPLFTGRYWSSFLSTEEHVLEVSRYIHRNAVDLGVAGTLSEYEWSSYGAYVGTKRRASWLRSSTVLAIRSLSAREYQTYVEEYRPAESTTSADEGRTAQFIRQSELAAALVLQGTRYHDLRSGLSISMAIKILDLTSADVAISLGVSSSVVRGRVRRFLAQKDADPELASLALKAAHLLNDCERLGV